MYSSTHFFSDASFFEGPGGDESARRQGSVGALGPSRPSGPRMAQPLAGSLRDARHTHGPRPPGPELQEGLWALGLTPRPPRPGTPGNSLCPPCCPRRDMPAAGSRPRGRGVSAGPEDGRGCRSREPPSQPPRQGPACLPRPAGPPASHPHRCCHAALLATTVSPGPQARPGAYRAVAFDHFLLLLEAPEEFGEGLLHGAQVAADVLLLLERLLDLSSGEFLLLLSFLLRKEDRLPVRGVASQRLHRRPAPSPLGGGTSALSRGLAGQGPRSHAPRKQPSPQYHLHPEPGTGGREPWAEARRTRGQSCPPIRGRCPRCSWDMPGAQLPRRAATCGRGDPGGSAHGSDSVCLPP